MAWQQICKVRKPPELLPAGKLLSYIAQVFEAKLRSDAACDREGRPRPPFPQLALFTLQRNKPKFLSVTPPTPKGI